MPMTICRHISTSKDVDFAIVEIETLAVRSGNVRRAAAALAWARENLELLRTEWARLNRLGRL
jgi:hypothetical protein